MVSSAAFGGMLAGFLIAPQPALPVTPTESSPATAASTGAQVAPTEPDPSLPAVAAPAAVPAPAPAQPPAPAAAPRVSRVDGTSRASG